jgi:hypothetical protein
MKARLFPDLPLVLVEWVDAAGDSEAEADPGRPKTLADFGGTMRTLEPGWLVKIDSLSVVTALSHWPDEKKAGHSNTIPLAMVTSVKGVDGTVYYERKKRALRKSTQGAA